MNYTVRKLICLRFAAPSQANKLENALYEPFASVLQNDVQGEHRWLSIQ